MATLKKIPFLILLFIFLVTVGSSACDPNVATFTYDAERDALTCTVDSRNLYPIDFQVSFSPSLFMRPGLHPSEPEPLEPMHEGVLTVFSSEEGYPPNWQGSQGCQESGSSSDGELNRGIIVAPQLVYSLPRRVKLPGTICMGISMTGINNRLPDSFRLRHAVTSTCIQLPAKQESMTPDEKTKAMETFDISKPVPILIDAFTEAGRFDALTLGEEL